MTPLLEKTIGWKSLDTTFWTKKAYNCLKKVRLHIVYRAFLLVLQTTSRLRQKHSPLPTEHKDFNIMNAKQIISIILAVLAVIYDVSPADIIPDVPFLGWVDDGFITAAAGLNLIEQFSGESSQTIARIARTIKWVTIILGIIVVLLIVILASVIVSMFK